VHGPLRHPALLALAPHTEAHLRCAWSGRIGQRWLIEDRAHAPTGPTGLVEGCYPNVQATKQQKFTSDMGAWLGLLLVFRSLTVLFAWLVRKIWRQFRAAGVLDHLVDFKFVGSAKGFLWQCPGPHMALPEFV